MAFQIHILLINFFIFTCFAIMHKPDIRNICEQPDIKNSNDMSSLAKYIVPELNGKRKGEAGKIAVIGGSAKYTGAPYFAAISALKVGADLVYVITTDDAAPIIKAYSPDLIVIPHKLIDMQSIIKTVHVVVIGPGLGREAENLKLAYDAIQICKDLSKPLVIDADGLYAVYKNTSVLKDYPRPGVVLTPNFMEAKRLKEAIPVSNNSWLSHWGNTVSVLLKGNKDEYYSGGDRKFGWSIEGIGSGRRAGGQGDILAGSLGAFLHWALQEKHCDDPTDLLSQSIASYAAAKLTRVCNTEGFKKHGRSMTASDMINEIHTAFDQTFL